jgi:hypothetical protein
MLISKRLLLVLCLAAANLPISLSFAQPVVTAQEIRFKDFFRWPVGPLGLEPTEALKLANNRKVQLLGYMVSQEKPPTGQFLLTPLPIRTSEEADGDADDLPANAVAVLLPDSVALRPVPHQRGLMKLTGILKVGRHQLADGRIVWVRLLIEDLP